MNKISGELAGLKPNQINALERTLRRRVPPAQLVTPELLTHLLDTSDAIRRRIGVLIDRQGHIDAVVVGNAHRIYLPDLGRIRAGLGRFRGLRWVQTQLRDGELSRDDLADVAKLRLDYLVSAFRHDNGRIKLRGAHLSADREEGAPYCVEQDGYSSEELVGEDFFAFVTGLENELQSASQKTVRAPDKRKNRAMLVAVGERRVDLDDSLDEMQELCRTAGVNVIGATQQVRKDVDPRYLVGRGKLEDIVLAALDQDAELVIFDRELTPAQSRSIGDATDLKVLDRTQLILDIFAQHAKSEDGRLQVELAQLKYNQPRLSEMSTAMSRLTGGIGGRGPGETKLEINKRRAHERITALERRIDELSHRRTLRRQKRKESGQPFIAIVGYTNAGKSTLLNALTQSEVTAEDKLFATLDPASRRLFFAPGKEAILSDTVGFIRDLPEDLINAFRATLEELEDADVLLHVIDASDPARASRVASVEGILVQMGLARKQRIRVWNKADRAEAAPLKTLRARGEIVISALEREGFQALRERLAAALFPASDA